MVQSGNKGVLRIYAWCMLLYVLIISDISWLNFLIYSVGVRLFIVFVCIIKMLSSAVKINKEWSGPLIFLFLFCLYSGIMTRGSYYQASNYLALFFSMSSVLSLTLEEKRYLLDFFTTSFVVILVISLFWWFLFLLGVNLPHTGLVLDTNDLHEYYDYYLFRLNYSSSISPFPRFASIFLEPGHVATPCVFLFFIHAVEGKIVTFKNMVLVLAVVFSLSLIGYGLLLFVMVLIPWFKKTRFRLLLTLIIIAAIGGVAIYALNRENTAIYAKILSRLEQDDELIIVGNNRTSMQFDSMYESFLHSSDRYFGIRKKLVYGEDWTKTSSGYKKFIVQFGIVGLVIAGLLIFSLFWKNRNMKTFAFMVILVIAFSVRNLLFGPLWLSIAITGFYMLGEEKQSQVDDINESDSLQITT